MNTNRTLQLATGAAVVASIIEYPLGQKYPLATPVSLPVRMAVAGGLAFVGVIVASYLLDARG